MKKISTQFKRRALFALLQVPVLAILYAVSLSSDPWVIIAGFAAAIGINLLWLLWVLWRSKDSK